MDTLSAVQPHCTPFKAGKSPGSWMKARRTSSDGQSRCYVALQPIFDRKGTIFAYEALCRTERSDRFTGDSRNATHGIVRDWLLDGLYRFTGSKPVFLNCTREDLVGGLVMLPPVPVVVEVLETVEVDDRILSICRKLKNFGHAIALDDFQLWGSDADLVELADFIKVDFQLCDRGQRREILRSVKGRRVRFVAEKVETRRELDAALDEGFDLFQGYYLARPVLLSKERTYVSWFNHIRLSWLSRQQRRRWR